MKMTEKSEIRQFYECILFERKFPLICRRMKEELFMKIHDSFMAIAD